MDGVRRGDRDDDDRTEAGREVKDQARPAIGPGSAIRPPGSRKSRWERRRTPATVAAAAVAEDDDVVGISCHSWEFLHFSEELVAQLAPHGITVVLGGSVITATDAALLRSRGVADIFGSSCTKDDIIEGIRRCTVSRRATIEAAEGGTSDPPGDGGPAEREDSRS